MQLHVIAQSRAGLDAASSAPASPPRHPGFSAAHGHGRAWRPAGKTGGGGLRRNVSPIALGLVLASLACSSGGGGSPDSDGGPTGPPPPAPPASGTIRLTTVTTGEDLDPDGYLVRLDGQFAARVGPNAEIELSDVPTGDRSLELAENTRNCIPTGDNSRAVSVASGSTTSVTFTFSCARVGGRITFASDRDGNLEIYVMNADGSGLQRLTTDPATDQRPRWSPDGSRIVFWSDRAGTQDVFVMNADGSNLINLTNSPWNDRNADWSPDGSKLAFVSDRNGDIGEIYVMNADGSDPVRLTAMDGLDGWPTWSPDGTRIAFHRDILPSSDAGTFLVDADGQNLQRLTSGLRFQPDWSPDGTRIVLADFAADHLVVMNVDGTGEQTLQVPGSHVRAPTWSPDGVKIVFELGEEPADVFTIFDDGSGPVSVASHAAHDARPDWGPE